MRKNTLKRKKLYQIKRRRRHNEIGVLPKVLRFFKLLINTKFQKNLTISNRLYKMRKEKASHINIRKRGEGFYETKT